MSWFWDILIWNGWINKGLVPHLFSIIRASVDLENEERSLDICSSPFHRLLPRSHWRWFESSFSWVFSHLQTWLESICRALLRYSGCIWPRQRGWSLHFEEQVGYKSFQLFLCLSLLVQPDEGVGGGLLGQLHLHQDGGGGGRVLLQGGQHSWNYWVLCNIFYCIFHFSKMHFRSFQQSLLRLTQLLKLPQQKP